MVYVVSPQGRKPQQKWGKTLDRLPGARTMPLPLAVWGIEIRIPTLSRDEMRLQATMLQQK
jgi:hypothetical protein